MWNGLVLLLMVFALLTIARKLSELKNSRDEMQRDIEALKTKTEDR